MSSKTDKNLQSTRKSLWENNQGAGNFLSPGVLSAARLAGIASKTDRFRTPQPFTVPGHSNFQSSGKLLLQQGNIFKDYVIARCLSPSSLTFLAVPETNAELQNNPDSAVLQLFPRPDKAEDFLLLMKKLSAVSSLQTAETRVTPEILSWGLDDSGYCYIITKYVEQPSLEYFIQAKAPLNEHKALFTIYKTAEKLDQAYSQWGPHGRLTPSKILFAMKKPLFLLNMGLMPHFVKERDTVFPKETFFYSSPEYITGGEISWQSDMYSLGIIFYRLLTGVLPFYADTAEAQKKAHLQETLPPVSGKNLPVKISTLTQEILDKMTRKDPAERFSSRLELLEALIKADEALPQELKE